MNLQELNERYNGFDPTKVIILIADEYAPVGYEPDFIEDREVGDTTYVLVVKGSAYVELPEPTDD